MLKLTTLILDIASVILTFSNIETPRDNVLLYYFQKVGKYIPHKRGVAIIHALLSVFDLVWACLFYASQMKLVRSLKANSLIHTKR